MTEFQVLYWHDIPLQVRAGGRGNRVSVELAPRFQAAADQVAMAVGLAETDDYLAGLRWSATQNRAGTAEEVAKGVAAELEDSYPEIDMKKMTRAVLDRKNR